MDETLIDCIQVLMVATLMVILLRSGETRKYFPHNGWSLIVGGFTLILFGSLLGISDNFEELSVYVVLGPTPVQFFLEKGVGYMGGLTLLTLGLRLWFPFVAGVEELSEMAGRLAVDNQKLSEEKRGLLLEKKQFQTLFQHATVGMATLDQDGRFDQVNTTYLDILGYDLSEIRKIDWTSLSAPNSREVGKRLLENLKNGDGKPIRLERECRNKAGSSVACLERITPVRRGKGEPIDYYVVQMENLAGSDAVVGRRRGSGALH